MNYEGLRIALNTRKPEMINDLHFVSYDKKVIIIVDGCFSNSKKQRLYANDCKVNLMSLIDALAGKQIAASANDNDRKSWIKARDEALVKINKIDSAKEFLDLPQERIDTIVAKFR